ncbi:MAG: biotin/lipoyl-binding protein [Lachnospiraceae bacterium]|nr:biotin/lipoyl-binding protein [Lachnospiraceae bacterium]
MEKKKHGKKRWIAIIVIAAVVVALIAGAAANSRRKKKTDTSSAIKSVKVTTGTIKNTITASGTLAEADSTDVKIPSGLTIKKVLVEEGDEVKKGDALAKVDQTSVKEQIYSVRSSISSIDSTLKSIKKKSGSKYNSQREMLNAQKKDLNKALTQLQKIEKSGKITSTVSGTVQSVNVADSDSSSTTTQSSTDQSSSITSALSGITGMSTKQTRTTAVQLSEKVPVTASSDGTIASSDGSTSESSDTEKSTSSDNKKNDSSTTKNSSSQISQEELEKMIQEQQKKRNTSSSSSSGSSSSKSSSSDSSASQNSAALEQYMNQQSSALSGATSGSTDTSSSTVSDVTYTFAFTVATGDKMDIDLSVDELDILNVEEGQSVTVTLDALEDQEFTGEITKVSHIGSNSGGSTKYTVTCQIDKSDDMLVGMNATAVIDVDSADNVLTIPLSAVQEENGTSYVYTTNDNGTLGGKTTVTTGLSDDTNVEITDGLSEGQTVYYKDLSGQELTSSQNDMQNMGANMRQQNGGGNGGGPSGDNGGGTPPSDGNGGPGGNGGN